MRIILTFSFLVLGLLLLAQKKDKPVEEYLPTENLEARKDANKPATRPDRKNISLVYVKATGGTLYGNACATYETHRMGFEYIIEPKNGMESKTRLGKFLNNSMVKTRLFFTRSPFWKLILNKRIKNCRRQTGDFVG